MSKPYILQEDRQALDWTSHHLYETYEQFVQANPLPDPEDSRFHLGLLPVPFVGAPASRVTRIFVLMLNPGFSASDYAEEEFFPGFATAAQRNLKGLTQDFPMYSLNPRFAGTSGFRYWTQPNKFGWLIEELRLQKRSSPRAALREIARKVCVIQLVPYHSSRFNLPSHVLEGLSSVRAAVNFVTHHVVPRVREGRRIVVATRRVKDWALDLNVHGAFAFEKRGEARRGALGPAGSLSNAIREQFSLLG